jgi:hypothetical protein
VFLIFSKSLYFKKYLFLIYLHFCKARLSARAGTDGNGTGRQKKRASPAKLRG